MKKIIFKKNAIKFLKKQTKVNKERLINAIYQLPNGDIKKLQGSTNYKRLRVGSFRVIFDETETVIDIVAIGNRGEIYNDY